MELVAALTCWLRFFREKREANFI